MHVSALALKVVSLFLKARSRKAPISSVMSVDPSVCPRISARFRLGKFSWNLILQTSTKICRGARSLVKLKKKSLGTLREHVCVVDSSTKYFMARR
jgi:hypothetical protein